MSRPRVPVTVEGLTALRARYAAAVADIIEVGAVAAGKVQAPSGDPRHVFDTPDGWRLIVSRERMPDGRVGVHLSASVWDDVSARRGGTFEQHLDAIVRTWRFIADTERTPLYLGLTAGGIPHFFVEQES